jgi:hypothetical protein
MFCNNAIYYSYPARNGGEVSGATALILLIALNNVGEGIRIDSPCLVQECVDVTNDRELAGQSAKVQVSKRKKLLDAILLGESTSPMKHFLKTRTSRC